MFNVELEIIVFLLIKILFRAVPAARTKNETFYAKPIAGRKNKVELETANPPLVNGLNLPADRIENPPISFHVGRETTVLID